MRKPQKRFKVMIGGRLRPHPKGQILTKNEAGDFYYYEVNGVRKLSPFTPEQLESMHESLIQPLSADGLLYDVFCHEYSSKKPLYQRWDKGSWHDSYSFNGSQLHLYRLKPQPKYIPVPECVKLRSSCSVSFIFNNERALYIDHTDGLPLLSKAVEGLEEPHQIDPTPLTEFKNGGIFYYAHFHIGDIRQYFVWCAKENKLYRFDNEGSYEVDSIEFPNPENFLKVIPVQEAHKCTSKQ